MSQESQAKSQSELERDTGRTTEELRKKTPFDEWREEKIISCFPKLQICLPVPWYTCVHYDYYY